MRFRLLRVILSFSILLFLLPNGCVDDKHLSTPEQKKTVKIITKRMKSEFWDVVRMGAEAAGKEFNVNVDFWGPKNELEIDLQIDMVREVINEKADALVLAACDYIDGKQNYRSKRNPPGRSPAYSYKQYKRGLRHAKQIRH